MSRGSFTLKAFKMRLRVFKTHMVPIAIIPIMIGVSLFLFIATTHAEDPRQIEIVLRVEE